MTFNDAPAKVIVEGLQQSARCIKPPIHGGLSDVDTFACHHLGLSVERQVVYVFAYRDMCQHCGIGLPFGDGQAGHVGNNDTPVVGKHVFLTVVFHKGVRGRIVHKQGGHLGTNLPGTGQIAVGLQGDDLAHGQIL